MISGVGFFPSCFSALARSFSVSVGSFFAGSGVGLLVLFRTNRSIGENLLILGAVYVLGAVFGYLSGFLF